MRQGNTFQQGQQGQLPHNHSMQYNTRSNLLSDDIGNIDISHETPIEGPPHPNNLNNPQQFAPPQQQQMRPYSTQGFQKLNNNNMNQQYPPQQQQYHTNNQMNNNMNMNMQANQQYQNNNNSYVQRQQQRHRVNTQQKQEKKTYSLNQKSFTNFFKAKNHGFGVGNKSKRNNGGGGGGGGGDDDEDGEVLIDDPDTSTITFNDIQKFGFKNGDKLNVSEDTTPLVPTLITKQSNNMTNTEYRKYLNNQRKNVLTSFNNQNTNPNSAGPGTNNGNIMMEQRQPPRAMSLQSGFNGGNPYLMQQQQVGRQPNGMPYGGMNVPNPSMPNIGSNSGNNSNRPTVGDPRTNSLMMGKPPMSYTQQMMPPQNNMNQPRAMSLTTNPNRQNMTPGFNSLQQQAINNPPPQAMNYGPHQNNMNQPQPQMEPQYRTMSLQQRPNTNLQQSTHNFRNQMPPTQQRRMSSDDHVGIQGQIQQTERMPSNGQFDIQSPPQIQNQMQEQSFNYNPQPNSNNPYMEKENKEPSTNVYSQQQQFESQYISSPQLQSHDSSNTASTNVSEFMSTNSQPSAVTNTTYVASNEMNDHPASPLRKQTSNKQVEQNVPVNYEKPKLNIIQLSKPKQDELEQEKIMNDIKHNLNSGPIHHESEQEGTLNNIEQEMAPIHNSVGQDEIMEDIKKETNPFSTKGTSDTVPPHIEEPYLRPSSLLQDGLSSLSLKENSVRDSTMTQFSSFSISPVKYPNPNDQEIYKLANNTDSKAFVTAEEFPSLDYKENVDKNSRSIDNIAKRDPKKDSVISVARASERISIYKASTKSSSTASLTSSKAQARNEEAFSQTPNSPSTLTASRTTSGIDTGDKVSLNESHISAVDDTFDYRNSPAESKPAEDKMDTQSKDEKKEGEEFIFDNTLYSPYKDITNTAPKHILISKEQLGLLDENKRLMNELTLLSSELAESIKRETLLDERINMMKDDNESKSRNNRFSTVSTSSISYTDFEKELRRKSSKVVELIQALNEERMKRFIAEEQVLLKENNAKPSSLDLIKKITELETKLQEKEGAINDLKWTLNVL